MSEKKKENLEEMFKDLEELIGKMENEEITLEQTFDLYNNGMELSKKCNLSIDEVEKRFSFLMKMERQMNFKEDCRKRTEKIEEIFTKIPA